MVREVGYKKSITHLIFKRLEKLLASRKKPGQIGVKKNSEREEGVICRASSQLCFSTLSEVKTTVVDHFSKLKPSKCLVKRIYANSVKRPVRENENRMFQIETDDFVANSRKAMLEWHLKNLNDVIFPMIADLH